MEKFTLFIGLNDGKTGKQIFTTAEAKQTVIKCALEYVDGLTISDAVGVYMGAVENSLRVEFMYTTRDAVEKIAAAVKIALNQNSILLQQENINITEV